MPPHPQDYYTFVGDPYQQENFISHCHPGWVRHPRYVILIMHVDGSEIRRSPHHLACKKKQTQYISRWWQLKDVLLFHLRSLGVSRNQFDLHIFFQMGSAKSTKPKFFPSKPSSKRSISMCFSQPTDTAGNGGLRHFFTSHKSQAAPAEQGSTGPGRVVRGTHRPRLPIE